MQIRPLSITFISNYYRYSTAGLYGGWLGYTLSTSLSETERRLLAMYWDTRIETEMRFEEIVRRGNGTQLRCLAR